jgi:hypothetical protein
VASGDGDTLVLPTSEPLAPGFEKPLFTYDASLGTLTQRAVLNTGTENASVSRDGSRFILVNAPNSAQQVTTVYNASFTALGTLPADLRGFVISPDGSTAYAYFSGSGLVRKFDLNHPNGWRFQESRCRRRGLLSGIVLLQDGHQPRRRHALPRRKRAPHRRARAAVMAATAAAEPTGFMLQ